VFSKKDVKLKLEIDKNQLNLKNDTKYLGLYIDKHLNWESHIEKLNLHWLGHQDYYTNLKKMCQEIHLEWSIMRLGKVSYNMV